MEKGVQISYLWHDNDVTELQLRVWNGEFGGQTNVYIGTGGLREIAAMLKGFPRTPSDTRELTLGLFGPQFAGGAMGINFSCKDLAGHVEAWVRIEGDHSKRSPPETVNLAVSVEPAAIDLFTAELDVRNDQGRGRAMLRLTS